MGATVKIKLKEKNKKIVEIIIIWCFSEAYIYSYFNKK